MRQVILAAERISSTTSSSARPEVRMGCSWNPGIGGNVGHWMPPLVEGVQSERVPKQGELLGIAGVPDLNRDGRERENKRQRAEGSHSIGSRCCEVDAVNFLHSCSVPRLEKLRIFHHRGQVTAHFEAFIGLSMSQAFYHA